MHSKSFIPLPFPSSTLQVLLIRSLSLAHILSYLRSSIFRFYLEKKDKEPPRKRNFPEIPCQIVTPSFRIRAIEVLTQAIRTCRLPEPLIPFRGFVTTSDLLVPVIFRFPSIALESWNLHGSFSPTRCPMGSILHPTSRVTSTLTHHRSSGVEQKKAHSGLKVTGDVQMAWLLRAS